MDESLRSLWSDYSITLESKATRTRSELSEARDDLRGLVSESEGAVFGKESEIVDLRRRIAGMTSELTPSRRQIENQATATAELQARVITAESDGENLNVMIEIKNITNHELGIALIEPSALAVLGDREYGLLSVSGVRPCKSMKDCRPLADFVSLQSGATRSILCVFAMHGDQPGAHPASFMFNFAVMLTDEFDQPTITTVGIGVPGIDIAMYK